MQIEYMFSVNIHLWNQPWLSDAKQWNVWLVNSLFDYASTTRILKTFMFEFVLYDAPT